MRQEQKLSEIGKFIRGVSFRKELGRSERIENDVLLLRSNNISEELNFDKSLYIPADKVKKDQMVKSNDILICMNSGSKHLVGKAVQIRSKPENPLTFGSFCGIFRCHENINQQYVGLFFRSEAYKKKIQITSSGVLINNLKPTDITDIKIPLPDIEEQHRIVSILEEIDDLRKKQRKSIELTRQMIPALFYEMFGDPIINNKMIITKVLNNCIRSLKSGFACGQSTRDESNNILHLRPMNISSSGSLSLLDRKYIPIGSLPDTNAFSIKATDVLFNNTNSKELVGKSCYVQKDLKNTAFSNHITRIRTNDILDPFFLAIQLQYLQQGGYFLSLCNKWIGQAGVNNQKLLDLSILVPPIQLQKVFTQKAQECLVLLEHQEQSLQKLDVLFETTINQFFSHNL